MEASFRDRVDKAFGSLRSSETVPEGDAAALWSLTNEEIERRKWNRHREESEDQRAVDRESGPSYEDDGLNDDVNDLSDGGEDEDNDSEKSLDLRRRNGDVDDEYLDVKSNIGRDCTLDYEEEEDEYDKVAVGMEQRGDRLHMSHVKLADYGIDQVNGYGELPNTFRAASRDPRANHTAALVRLKEDADAASNLNDALGESKGSEAMNIETESLKKGESDSENLRSILKRKENFIDPRSHKRVRFALNSESKENEPLQMASNLSSNYASGVPDYLINPSRYTRYTFDSSDEMDDQSNKSAYMEFFQSLKKGNADSMENDTNFELPKSITFTPQKTVGGNRSGEEIVDKNLKSKSLCIMGEDDSNETGISAMEEDISISSGRRGRQYRSRNSTSDDNIEI